jgi:hypothetical protein
LPTSITPATKHFFSHWPTPYARSTKPLSMRASSSSSITRICRTALGSTRAWTCRRIGSSRSSGSRR